MQNCVGSPKETSGPITRQGPGVEKRKGGNQERIPGREAWVVSCAFVQSAERAVWRSFSRGHSPNRDRVRCTFRGADEMLL